MWRNYLPIPINPAQSSEEDNYESTEEPDPLVSPRRPHQSPTASPRALLQPDPPAVEEVLEGARDYLRNLPNRRPRNQPNRPPTNPVVPPADPPPVIMPDQIISFEDQNALMKPEPCVKHVGMSRKWNGMIMMSRSSSRKSKLK